MKEVPMFQASDNTIFPTADECKAHEALLANEKEISAFIEAGGLTKATATRAKNVIRHFLQWRANGELPPAPEKK